uniref:Peptidase S9 prolyl oligopeptidase catalytic domain-containing protein n=1 Tax=Chromera velia CCMP2878 TaxID=1169474 RepID=A0A0G4H2S2_9ALVE|eukprot:Cvel_5607.t1-p1 / transcript=Cvel_5607.t1 / gene=Cvel_5607 / organism=Chromera_velia_CCMP2878 / gene_product=Probable dipeptidyl-aminopeptidase B, putative / transcript_product=Probable dipeptidyl-aminopeptidase B, putative / location=Cvel_scaffold264:19334-27576(-) / protein_length=1162 / sequence_SO=supercontig / SO=protein_coding / is_pseudo=false
MSQTQRIFSHVQWVFVALAAALGGVSLLSVLIRGGSSPAGLRGGLVQLFGLSKDEVKPFGFDEAFNSAYRPRLPAVSWSRVGDAAIEKRGDGVTYRVEWPSGEETALYSVEELQAAIHEGSGMTSADEKPKLGTQVLSPDESLLLVAVNTLKVYRHSTTAVYFIYDLKSKTAVPLVREDETKEVGPGKRLQLAEWAPSTARSTFSTVSVSRISYVESNDVWVAEVSREGGEDSPLSVNLWRVTDDGAENKVQSGLQDWVYEEEIFQQTSAVWWAPDGGSFAFLRFEIGEVPEYTFPFYSLEDAYNDNYRYKYPKPGYPISKVALFVHECDRRRRTVEIPVELPSSSSSAVKEEEKQKKEKEGYVTEIVWLSKTRMFARTMNRIQDRSSLWRADFNFLSAHEDPLMELSQIGQADSKTWLMPGSTVVPLTDSLFVDKVEFDSSEHLGLFDAVTGVRKTMLTRGRDTRVDSTVAFDASRQIFWFVSTGNLGAPNRLVLGVRVPLEEEGKQMFPKETELFSFGTMEMQRREMSIDTTDGEHPGPLQSGGHWMSASFSATRTFAVLRDTASSPLPSSRVLQVIDEGGKVVVKEVKVLETNEKWAQKMKEFNLPTRRFLTVEAGADKGVPSMDALIVLPPSFPSLPDPQTGLDPKKKLDLSYLEHAAGCGDRGQEGKGTTTAKKFAVLFHVYGGPGAQLATAPSDYLSERTAWHSHLASSHEFIIVTVDPVGSGGKSLGFERDYTYKRLGHWEALSLQKAIDQVRSSCFVDAQRTALWGWSYGGYLSSRIASGAGLETERRSERKEIAGLPQTGLRTVMAVAPVTDWRLYDASYTERYMQTPQENEAGYNSSSVVILNREATRRNGGGGNEGICDASHYFVIHGLADDNVHFQNSALLAKELEAANVQFKSFYYPDRDHSLTDPVTQASNLQLYHMLEDHLLAELTTGGSEAKKVQTSGGLSALEETEALETVQTWLFTELESLYLDPYKQRVRLCWQDVKNLRPTAKDMVISFFGRAVQVLSALQRLVPALAFGTPAFFPLEYSILLEALPAEGSAKRFVLTNNMDFTPTGLFNCLRKHEQTVLRPHLHPFGSLHSRPYSPPSPPSPLLLQRHQRARALPRRRMARRRSPRTSSVSFVESSTSGGSIPSALTVEGLLMIAPPVLLP